MPEVLPPPFPPTAPYTSAYCEENVYCLAREFSTLAAWRVSVVFISNTSRTVAVWQQKASTDAASGFVVVWDYHVILALTYKDDASGGLDQPEECWIYDMDTRLRQPCRAGEYFARTFLDQEALEPRWRSSFRVVPGQVFLDNFASDRSHMLREAVYIAPPPLYDAITGQMARARGVSNNLMSEFVRMDVESFGEVVGDVGGVLGVLRSASRSGP
ncbi:hypothetical protein EXIGLDRAFT_121340 [Exidia glandulosa HHB12029]|uniref:Protein N-terminal glutamine amidohydrolase n=1 Tax=Exidia glandulosa HHB12029 TaxID=1314781 RepID=A0A165GFK8_EXIGL|nr:hypothetical protein EXIGLDRAFT_121340 [Exidia glandulosa HHB12029]